MMLPNCSARIVFGLNALNGRVPLPDRSLGGPWNYTNVESLICYTASKGYKIHGWELGMLVIVSICFVRALIGRKDRDIDAHQAHQIKEQAEHSWPWPSLSENNVLLIKQELLSMQFNQMMNLGTCVFSLQEMSSMAVALELESGPTNTLQM